MPALCFLDANILLYVHDDLDAEKATLSAHLIEQLGRRRSFTVSLQVLNEYYNVAIRKPQGRERRFIYRENVRRYRGFCASPFDDETVDLAWTLQENCNYQWWDLLIVAAAVRSGCKYLLTEDMDHGRLFGATTIVNPFFALPDDLYEKLGIPPLLNFGDPWA